MDLEREVRSANLRVSMLIDIRAHQATYRIWNMHTVGTGICHCGGDMEDHSGWDNHAPVELRIDKRFGEEE